MPTTLEAVRARLAVTLETIDTFTPSGGDAQKLRVAAYNSPQINPPCAVVGPIRVRYNYTGAGARFDGGLHTYEPTIRVYAATSLNDQAQKVLDALCGWSTDSIYYALMQDATGGGIWASMDVAEMSGFEWYEYPPGSGLFYLGAEWLVNIKG